MNFPTFFSDESSISILGETLMSPRGRQFIAWALAIIVPICGCYNQRTRKRSKCYKMAPAWCKETKVLYSLLRFKVLQNYGED